jgi:hypothetical protein
LLGDRQIVYAWAHLFAFRDRLTRRPLSWSPTGRPSGRSSRRLRLVKALIVAWPLTTLSFVIAGSAAHMGSPFDLNYWPPLATSALYALTAALVLQPLGETVPAEPKMAAVMTRAAPGFSTLPSWNPAPPTVAPFSHKAAPK